MHKLLIPFFALLTVTCFGQQNDDGKVIGDTLFLNSGAKFVVGQKIKLGIGSSGDRHFEYVFVSPWALGGATRRLGSDWAGLKMLIKSFRLEGNKRTGKKFILVLGGGDITNYWCDIVHAVEMKEVLVPGVNDPKSENKDNFSVADELKKMKELYDQGILTKDEYEAQKKKLLNQ